jgi:hypothetical protein
MIQHTLTTENYGEQILNKKTGKNTIKAVCPYSQPLVIPDKFGIQVAPRFCGSSCPMFDIFEFNNETFVNLLCNRIKLKIEQDKESSIKLL